MITPIKGKPGRYFDSATGQEISRRQRDKLKFGAEHVANINKASKTRTRSGEGAAPKMVRYASLVDHFKNSEALRLNTTPNKIKVKGNSESAQLFKASKDIVKNFGALNKAWKKQSKKSTATTVEQLEKEYREFRRQFFAKKYPNLNPDQIDKFIQAGFKIIGYREPEFNRYV